MAQSIWHWPRLHIHSSINQCGINQYGATNMVLINTVLTNMVLTNMVLTNAVLKVRRQHSATLLPPPKETPTGHPRSAMVFIGRHRGVFLF